VYTSRLRRNGEGLFLEESRDEVRAFARPCAGNRLEVDGLTPNKLRANASIREPWEPERSSRGTDFDIDLPHAGEPPHPARPEDRALMGAWGPRWQGKDERGV